MFGAFLEHGYGCSCSTHTFQETLDNLDFGVVKFDSDDFLLGTMSKETGNADERQGGGCQCGRIRYLASRKPLALYVCHCTECQKQSSSAFGISFTIRRDTFELVRGDPGFWARQTASGHTLDCAFCRDCGSRLWHQSSGSPETLNVKAGSLDEPVDLTHAVHIWTSRKLPGVVIPDGALCYPEEPDR